MPQALLAVTTGNFALGVGGFIFSSSNNSGVALDVISLRFTMAQALKRFRSNTEFKRLQKSDQRSASREPNQGQSSLHLSP